MDYSMACTLLGVEVGSDEPTVKKAYRKMAMKYHPDRNPDNGGKFIEIQKAYDFVKDRGFVGSSRFTHTNIFDIKIER